MRINQLYRDSLIDGPGVCGVVVVQGCNLNCPGCQNPHTHAFYGGVEMTPARILDALITPITTGIVISGGEPTSQLTEVYELAALARDKGLTTMMYSGLEPEELLVPSEVIGKLPQVDYLCLGRYKEDERDTTLMYRGSANQQLFMNCGREGFQPWNPENPELNVQ